MEEVFRALKKTKSNKRQKKKTHQFHLRILYLAKLSFRIEGGIKIFHDKQKLKQYMITTEDSKRNPTHRR
jgi:hypothetical protein